MKSAFMTLFRTFVFKCELSDFKPDSPIFVNGASNVIWLQPLTEIIIRELEKFPIDEMFCYA